MTHSRTIALSTFAAALVAAFLVGCGKGDAPPAASIAASDGTAAVTAVTPGEPSTDSPARPPRKVAPVDLYPEVLIKTSAGDIRIKLNAAKSPITVENFLDNYVRRGFYAGTIVHYVEAGNMLAAGGFTPEYEAKLPRAPIINEAANGLKNKRGVIAMARDPEFSQSATSQFFINLVDNPSLDHRSADASEEFGYCVFGEVVSGMDVVDAIAKVAVHDQGDFISTPVEPIVIESIEQVK